MVTEMKTNTGISYIDDTVANVQTALNAGANFVTFAQYQLVTTDTTGDMFHLSTISFNINIVERSYLSETYDITYIITHLI